MRKRFVTLLGLLLLSVSHRASADCPSSWYNSGDTSTIGDCGASSGYLFSKTSHWWVQWYCDSNGYQEFLIGDSGECGCAGGPCWPDFSKPPYIDATNGDWVQETRDALCGGSVSSCSYGARVWHRRPRPSCCNTIAGGGGCPPESCGGAQFGCYW